MRVRIVNAGKSMDISLPCSDMELNFVMKRAGNRETVPRCRLLSVVDEANPLTMLEGSTVNMDEVNFFAKRMESLTEYERKVLSVYAEMHAPEDVKDCINLTYSTKGLSFLTNFSDPVKVGRRIYLDEHQGMSEEEAGQMNFIRYAGEVFRQARAEVLPYGVFVSNGFAMQEVYNGKTFPEYIHEPDKVVAVLELQNQSGDTEYLYLPADICSLNKVKERLGIQEYRECLVKDIHNQCLPERLLEKKENLCDAETLSHFNELCQTVVGFDEEKMKRLEMAAEFLEAKFSTDYTYIAKTLDSFEIIPGVHNDEEYGKYWIEESGLFDVDELIRRHINYAAFGQEKREGALAESAYTEKGFVGVDKACHEYLQYGGEYAEPLEFNENDYETFCLYSPLTAQLYENGEDSGYLFRSDLTPYAKKIADAIEDYGSPEEMARGLMHYYSEDSVIASKVFSARPKVAEIDGELYGVLECKIMKPLFEEEIAKLKDYWTGQMSDGWGEGFEQQAISVSDGELYVSFWNSENFWSVMTEEELYGNQVQGMEMSV